MNENKILVTQEMIDSLSDMIKSANSEDVKFAVNVLEMRDKTNVDSENKFRELANLIIDNDKLFPLSKQWIIKLGDKRLILKNDKSSWNDKVSAERALSTHLTAYLGKSAKNTNVYSGWNYRNDIHQIIKWKATSPQQEQLELNNWNRSNRYTNYNLVRPNKPEYVYDPNFDKNAFLKAKKEEMASEIGQLGSWSKDKQYFKAIKMVFGGGKELRDFLISNKIIEIVQV